MPGTVDKGAGAAPDPDHIEAGRRLFARTCDFVKGVVDLDGLPPDTVVEVAFAGRSNVGKSSLINALTGRKTLARTSNTPGRTQEINFFMLDGESAAPLMLVDLPGYGYARASKSKVRAWTGLTMAYLRGRPNLRRVVLLVDGRHGLKPSDRQVMTDLDEAAVSYQIVLTKMDKVKAAEQDHRMQSVGEQARRHPACHPCVLPTSALKGLGIPELRAQLAALLQG